VRDPETGMNAAARGEVTRFVQFGTLSVAASLGVALLAFAQALALHVWEIATIGIAIALIAGILLSTLTIEIDDQGIFWCFTGGLLSRRVEFTDVARCEPTRWQSMSYGYRMWFNKRAWMITGRGAMALDVSGSGIQYVVGCDDPAAVCAEIERRMTARTTT